MRSDHSHRLLTAEDYVRQPSVPADHRIRYGEDSQQFADLYLPQGDGPHPVVVMIHGGCWRAQYDLSSLGAVCKSLADDGLAVWSLEYRRAANGGDWPNMFHDVAHAADRLREVAAEHDLDLGRVASAGHSAGGHLALWLAARQRWPQGSPLYSADPLPLCGVVSLGGVPDLIGAIAQNICGDAVPIIMGGSPDDAPESYAHGSPMELLPLGVRQIHITGELDEEMLANVQGYVAAAQQAGDQVELITPPETGHFEVVVATSAAWPLVKDAIKELL